MEPGAINDILDGVFVPIVLSKGTAPVPGLLDKKGFRRCHLLFNQRWHLINAVLSKGTTPYHICLPWWTICRPCSLADRQKMAFKRYLNTAVLSIQERLLNTSRDTVPLTHLFTLVDNLPSLFTSISSNFALTVLKLSFRYNLFTRIRDLKPTWKIGTLTWDNWVQLR
jgi:hypothetical protein